MERHCGKFQWLLQVRLSLFALVARLVMFALSGTCHSLALRHIDKLHPHSSLIQSYSWRCRLSNDCDVPFPIPYNSNFLSVLCFSSLFFPFRWTRSSASTTGTSHWSKKLGKWRRQRRCQVTRKSTDTHSWSTSGSTKENEMIATTKRNWPIEMDTWAA